jgi:hypothetical protein
MPLKRLSTKSLLKIAIDVSLQAASALDGPVAAACSGSLGRRNGTIAFDEAGYPFESGWSGIVAANCPRQPRRTLGRPDLRPRGT